MARLKPAQKSIIMKNQKGAEFSKGFISGVADGSYGSVDLSFPRPDVVGVDAKTNETMYRVAVIDEWQVECSKPLAGAGDEYVVEFTYSSQTSEQLLSSNDVIRRIHPEANLTTSGMAIHNNVYTQPEFSPKIIVKKDKIVATAYNDVGEAANFCVSVKYHTEIMSASQMNMTQLDAI